MHTNGDTSVDRSATGRSTRRGLGQRYSIPEAAKVLGLTEEAVRQRVKRGTLDSIKVGESLFVLLDTDTLDDTSSDRLIDQQRHVGEGSSDTSRLVESLWKTRLPTCAGSSTRRMSVTGRTGVLSPGWCKGCRN